MILKIISTVLWFAILLGIIGLIKISFQYINPNLNSMYLHSKQWEYDNLFWRINLFIHVFSALFAIVFGFTQFIKKFIFQYKKWHHIFGKIYIITVLLLAAPSGFIMGLYAGGGIMGKTSFCLASLFWFITTYFAYDFIIKKNIAKHLFWMSISYALALSAVTLRFYTLIVNQIFIPLPSHYLYAAIAWISWILNVCVALMFNKKRYLFNFYYQN